MSVRLDDSREEQQIAEEGSGGQFLENGHNQRPTTYYARSKTVSEGVMDLGLMVANASQLKTVIDGGSSHDYYYILIVLISLCLLLQIGVGALILDLWLKEEDNEDDPRSVRINSVVVGCIFAITVLNIIVGVFGLSAPSKS